jgi:nicotinamide-nucleotide amidase
MEAEILAIGAELLLGETVDTNSAYLARQLAAAGVDLIRTGSVGDDTARIAAAVNDALLRADLLICTGGLGPTMDDLTREGIALALGRPLVFHVELLEQIAARFTAMQRTMSESNRRQAYLPQGARAIHNPRGTAPAFLIEDPRGTVISLPGVPSEMMYLFEQAVLPYLRRERGITRVIRVHTLHAVGLTESVIGERIADLMTAANPVVGISAKRARYELRIAARAESEAEAEALIAQTSATIAERIGDALLGTAQLHELVTAELAARGQQLAISDADLRMAVFHALRSAPAADQVIHAVQTAVTAPAADSAAAAAAARQAAYELQQHYAVPFALAVRAAQRADDGFIPHAIALVTPSGLLETERRIDAQLRDGWEFIGTAALDLLRRSLESHA